jgi:hypothetical protein
LRLSLGLCLGFFLGSESDRCHELRLSPSAVVP